MTVSRKQDTHNLQGVADLTRAQGLWKLLSGFRLIYLVAALSLGISAIFRTGTFFLIRYLVDDVLVSENLRAVLPMIAAGFLGLAVLQGIFTYYSGRLAARTSEGVAQKLRDYLFNHIQRLSFGYHDTTPTGDLIQRTTSDVDAIRRFFADQAIGFGRIVFLFAINFSALLFLNLQLALFSVIVVPLLIMLSFFFFRRISAAYEEYQKQDAILSTTLQENLSGVRVVKAFARQEYERDKFDRENWEKFLRGKRLLLIHSLYWPISEILEVFQMLAGFAYGAILAIDGTISVGTYLAYAGLVISTILPMGGLGRLVVQISAGLVSMGRIIEILKIKREELDFGITSSDCKMLGEINFDGVGFQYDEHSRVLKDISFHCTTGQSVALLGPTGSGKTTLVNLLPRFYEYNQGSLTLDGRELNTYSRKFLRENIGIVEQEPFLFSRTIRGNITHGVAREVNDQEIEQAARAAAIHDVILDFPSGYSTLVGEKGVTLSGGQKQRIAIARTLLKDPCILIFDDSTSSVDPETEGEIREALQRLMEGRTTFIIAHRIQSVRNADMIIVLDKGRIVQMGIHDELMSQDAIYRQVHDLQTQIELELEKEISGV